MKTVATGIRINLALVLLLCERMRGRVTYRFGAKSTRWDADSSEISEIDCSGFVWFALKRATNGALPIPDGSANQHAFCEKMGYRKVPYAEAIADLSGRLYIAFIAPAPVGHVWLVSHGLTLESHGHVGVDRREADCSALRAVCACYELPVS